MQKINVLILTKKCTISSTFLSINTIYIIKHPHEAHQF